MWQVGRHVICQPDREIVNLFLRDIPCMDMNNLPSKKKRQTKKKKWSTYLSCRILDAIIHYFWAIIVRIGIIRFTYSKVLRLQMHILFTCFYQSPNVENLQH